MKRIEVSKGEYSYDNAVNKVIEMNEIYNPAWIYVDAGAGEYQVETLHMYGDSHPESMLKHKVKKWSFKNTLEVEDPITREVTKEMLKVFMVNQLQIVFERERILLSPFDEILHKQLIDYEVVRMSANRDPVFSSVNEHFVDALGLAYLAFVLQFPELTKTVKSIESIPAVIEFSKKQLGETRYKNLWTGIENEFNQDTKGARNFDSTDLPGDRPTMFRVPLNSGSKSSNNRSSWGSRSGKRSSGRSMW